MRREKPFPLAGFVLVSAMAVLILCIGILSWVPPVSKDALVHHLAIPKLYLEHGGIYEIPTMPYSYYPMNLNLLYMVPLWLGSDIAAKLIHFCFALLTAYLLFRYLRRRLSTVYGLFGGLLFLSLPIIVKLSITVYVDLGVIFFSTLALLLLLMWAEHGFRMKYLILAGVACGLAMGTKYTGLALFAVLGLLVPFLSARDSKVRGSLLLRPVALGALFLLIALVVFSPWMLRNYLWKSNPVHPLYGSLFKKQETVHRPPLSSQAGHKIASAGKVGFFTYRKVIYGESWWETALLPLRIFFQGKDGNPRYFDGVLNPFLLILAIFAFYPRAKDPPDWFREMKVFLLYSIVVFLFTFFTSALRIRYISPIIPPLVILSTFGLRNLFETAGRLKGTAMGRAVHGFALLSVVCALVINAQYMVGQFQKVNPLGYISGEVSREEYISRYRREFPALQYVNRNLPPDSKILFLFLGKRGYYCDREYIPDTEGQVRSLYNMLREAKDPKDIETRLRRKGITHVLADLNIFDRWLHDLLDDTPQGHAREFFKKRLTPLYFRNGVGLYALRSP